MTEASPAALRAFLKVAEELHFRRAAEALFLTTPALSQQIARLEKALQTQLFVRSSRRVELTPAGQQLIPLARDAVGAHNRIKTWAQRLKVSEIRIGFTGLGPSELTAQIFADAAEALPEVRLRFARVEHDMIERSLKDGDLDVAFQWGPFRAEGIETRLLTQAPRVLVLRGDDPLAAKGRLTVADLSAIALHVPDTDDPEFAGWSTADPYSERELSQIGSRVRGVEEAFPVIATAGGGFLIPQVVADGLRHSDIVYRPVDGLESSPFSLSYLPNAFPDLVRIFVDIVLDCVERMCSDPREA